MARHLANTDPLGAVYPTPARTADAGFDGVRIVARPGALAYARACRDAKRYVLADLARESFSFDPVHYPEYTIDRILWYGIWFPADAWQLGNEPDQIGPSSWTLASTEYARFANTAARILRDAAPKATIVAAGLASGEGGLDYLDRCGSIDVDALAVHVYGRSPGPGHWGPFGDVGVLLEAYRRFGKPLWVTEYGAQSHEIGEAEQARYLAAMVDRLDGICDVAALFSWHSFPEWSGGLHDITGAARPALAAVKEALSVAEFKLGFKTLADRLGPEAVGEPIEDEHPFTDAYQLQQTTKGLMIWSKAGNECGFLPFLQPK